MCRKTGYDPTVLQHTAFLVIDPFTVSMHTSLLAEVRTVLVIIKLTKFWSGLVPLRFRQIYFCRDFAMFGADFKSIENLKAPAPQRQRNNSTFKVFCDI